MVPQAGRNGHDKNKKLAKGASLGRVILADEAPHGGDDTLRGVHGRLSLHRPHTPCRGHLPRAKLSPEELQHNPSLRARPPHNPFHLPPYLPRRGARFLLQVLALGQAPPRLRFRRLRSPCLHDRIYAPLYEETEAYVTT